MFKIFLMDANEWERNDQLKKLQNCSSGKGKAFCKWIVHERGESEHPHLFHLSNRLFALKILNIYYDSTAVVGIAEASYP
jgi:hypothetical protein